ncbi:hypothetical protein HYW17_00065 [Candidatus Uhrbacteria bacterium]|nr:hypothetical protein [Candidatus Uhrbacteria bacterium]
MLLDGRKAQLLSAVVKEYARTAQPVASGHLQEELGVSSATVRNEMAELERGGYLRQPHTSAGRVPTEEGYRYYVAHCLEEQNVKNEVDEMQATVRPALPHEARMKRLARELASEMREGVFIGFTPQSSYYTGLSYLFDQPEFESVDFVRHIGDIVDNLDQIVAKLFEEVAPGVQVYVGSENPFGAQCGTVLLRTGIDRPMMGVLGPMRMDYDRAIGMMKGLGRILEIGY